MKKKSIVCGAMVLGMVLCWTASSSFATPSINNKVLALGGCSPSGPETAYLHCQKVYGAKCPSNCVPEGPATPLACSCNLAN